ncbi:Thioredoxin-like 4A [Rhodosporidiobolus nylandii]
MLNRLRMELLSLVLRLAAPPAYSRELYWERRATWRSCCIVMIDLGTGNNNKVNWAMEDKQELMDIRDDYSTRLKY